MAKIERPRAIRSALRMLGTAVVILSLLGFDVRPVASQPTVITLTQTGCQFIEPEDGDRKFQTTAASDCEQINARTAKERLSRAKTLELQPGKYVFRVTNQNVPYELGFYLRGAGIGRLTLPKVSGGGLTMGASRDYEIDLQEGEYIYSCPLNPTPNYRLVVKR